MAVAEKFETSLPQHQEVPDAPETVVREADSRISAEQTSPARVLQERLSSELTFEEDKYSPRVVTMFVIMFCASTWVGGYLLYSMF